MAKFLYKMQNILDIKLRLETQAKTAYAQRAAALAEEEDKLNVLFARKKGYEEHARELATAKLNIPLIVQCSDAIRIMDDQIKKQIVKVHVAQKNLDMARENLNQAMQERKTHEKLKEKAFDQFKLELNDQEKKEIDELVSFNYNDNNKETGE